MKDNKLIKSGVSGVVDGENQTVGDDELELINRFTRRNLAKNEVYAFSVVPLAGLCAMCAVRTSRCVLTKRVRFTAQSFVAVNL